MTDSKQLSPFLFVSGFSLLCVVGCEGPASLGEAGSLCYRAQECERGLICVEGECSSSVESSVPDGAGPPPDFEVAPVTPTDSQPDAGSLAEALDGG